MLAMVDAPRWFRIDDTERLRQRRISFALSGIATGKCDAYYQSWMTDARCDDVHFQGTLQVLALALMAGKFVY